MPNVSKAEFARHLKISKARVSQYLAAGLPTVSGGRIDLDAGIRWVADNLRRDPGQGGKGADRAIRIVKSKVGEVGPANPVTPTTLNVRLEAFEVLIREVGKIAARSAVAAGAPMKVAYALEQMVSVDLAHFAIDQLPAQAREPVSISDWPWEGLGYGENEPDWHALAREAGEPAAESAWSEFLDALPWSRRVANLD